MVNKVTIHAVGDISPSRDRGKFLLEHTASLINQADIRFCQLETPFSDRAAKEDATDTVSAGTQDAAALIDAGFDVCSFASNRCYRWGELAFLDTLDLLKKNNIRVIGAGMNIEEARRPAIFERNGTRVAFLAYNSVVVSGSEAGQDKPGCVPMRASTSYEQVDWQPGAPPLIKTWADKDHLSALTEDIRRVRAQADIVVVSMHWGVHLVPAVIAMYQHEVGHAAIDAGADLILGHHAHILKGIDVYKGKVIFFSMGNWCFDSHHSSPKPKKPGTPYHTKALYKVQFDPEYPTYTFPADSRKTILVKVVISNKAIEQISFQPAMINKQGQPELLSYTDKRSDEVYDYMKWVCKDQDLHTAFYRQGDEIIIAASEGVAA